MVQEQRASHGIVTLRDWILHGVPLEESDRDAGIRRGLTGESHGHRADVAALDSNVKASPGGPACQGDRDIAPTTGHVEDTDRIAARPRRQPGQRWPEDRVAAAHSV